MTIDLKLVQKAYASWLNQFQWQWFCTLTFRVPPHPEAADKKFRYWIHRLNCALHGKRYPKKGQGIYWVLALEYHRSEAIHFHALLADTQDLNVRFKRTHAKQLWCELAGFARIDGIIDDIDEQRLAVTNYLSKYVTKGGELTVSDTLKNYAIQSLIVSSDGKAI